MVVLTAPTNQVQPLPKELVQALRLETSCAPDGRSENVLVEPIVIPELELCNVKWHVLFADLVPSQ